MAARCSCFVIIDAVAGDVVVVVLVWVLVLVFGVGRGIGIGVGGGGVVCVCVCVCGVGVGGVVVVGDVVLVGCGWSSVLLSLFFFSPLSLLLLLRFSLLCCFGIAPILTPF